MILGIDTSCYTTSVALAENGKIIADKRAPLKVQQGERGLRQSDGVFMHLKALPLLLEELAKDNDFSKIKGVIASTQPRPEETSYMPVFTVGTAFAKTVAMSLNLPFYETSHQEGHIMAALHTCPDKFEDEEFVSVHISGGTSEILYTRKTSSGYNFSLSAGTLDLHAGQLVDRIGVKMGLNFPCGAELDKLALSTKTFCKLPVTLKGADFHLSGAESKAEFYLGKGEPYESVARGVLVAISESIKKSLDVLYSKAPFKNVIIGGGVSASKVIREELKSHNYNIHFSDPAYSVDNACGVALIGDLLR